MSYYQKWKSNFTESAATALPSIAIGLYMGLPAVSSVVFDTEAERDAAFESFDPDEWARTHGFTVPVDTFIELPILGVNYCAFDTRDLFYVRKGHDVDIALYFRGIDYSAKGTYPQFVTFADKSERDAAYTRIVAAMKASRSHNG